MTPEQEKYFKLEIKYARLLGEYQGTLQGILFWNIPKELKQRLEKELKRLKDSSYE